MADVFLSYAHEDRAVAEKLARFLSTNGLDVWWDRRLFAGDDFSEVIERALEEARCAIVLWSPQSVSSHWVRGEAQAALDLDKLIPIQIEECKLPIQFRHLHTPSIYRSDDQLVALAKLLTEKLAGSHASTKSPTPIKDHEALAQTKKVVFAPETRSSFLADLRDTGATPGDTYLDRVNKRYALLKKYPFRFPAFIVAIGLSVGALFSGYWYFIGDCPDYEKLFVAAIEIKAAEAAREFNTNGDSAEYRTMKSELDRAVVWMPRTCVDSIRGLHRN